MGLRGPLSGAGAGGCPTAAPRVVEVFNALRWIVRAGSPWHAVYQQARRGLDAGVFETMAHDLRMLLREASDRLPQPRAVIFDRRTVHSTPESGVGAGYDG